MMDEAEKKRMARAMARLEEEVNTDELLWLGTDQTSIETRPSGYVSYRVRMPQEEFHAALRLSRLRGETVSRTIRAALAAWVEDEERAHGQRPE